MPGLAFLLKTLTQMMQGELFFPRTLTIALSKPKIKFRIVVYENGALTQATCAVLS